MDLLKRKAKIRTDGLFLLLLGGGQGEGKSYFMGTNPTGNILHLHGKSEAHGGASALKNAKESLISVSWATGDTILGDISQILSPETIKKYNITRVCVDSLTALARDVKETQIFKQKCKTPRGDHNSYKEGEAILDLLSKVISWLSILYHEHNVDIICSLHANVTAYNEDGSIAEAKPDLPSFGIAEYLPGQFPDVMIIGRVGEKGTPMLQCNAIAKRSSTNEKTKLTKFTHFRPRLQSVEGDLPAMIEPTVQALLDLKKGK